MSKAQREKGKRGEREIANMLKEMGFDARRTAQYCGNTGDASDVVGIEGFHLEIKRCETTKIPEWMRQAKSDCGGNIPCVVHRRSKEEWLATLPAEEFFRILRDRR